MVAATCNDRRMFDAVESRQGRVISVIDNIELTKSFRLIANSPHSRRKTVGDSTRLRAYASLGTNGDDSIHSRVNSEREEMTAH